TLLVLSNCISLSTVDALATVTPISSLISCAYICLFERKTFKRGHSSVPNTRFRTRRCLCLRASFFVTLVIIYRHSLLHMYRLQLFSCFTFFLTDIFFFITNTFSFVRFRRSDGADFGSCYTYLLFIDPFNDNFCVFRNVYFNAFLWFKLYVM